LEEPLHRGAANGASVGLEPQNRGATAAHALHGKNKNKKKKQQDGEMAGKGFRVLRFRVFRV
jgi:hypothetical protein